MITFKGIIHSIPFLNSETITLSYEIFANAELLPLPYNALSSNNG